MTASTILVVELVSDLFLKSQRNFFNLQFDWFLSLRGRVRCKLISACHAAQGDVRAELSTGIGQAARRVKTDPRRSAELDQRPGDGCSLFIVDLHNQGLSKDHAGRARLFATTRLDQCSAEPGRF